MLDSMIHFVRMTVVKNTVEDSFDKDAGHSAINMQGPDVDVKTAFDIISKTYLPTVFDADVIACPFLDDSTSSASM